MNLIVRSGLSSHIFNAWHGCSKISDGCENCYAESISSGSIDLLGSWGPNGRRVINSESYFSKAIEWNLISKNKNKRDRVFVNLLSDVFEDHKSLVNPRRKLGNLILDCQELDWLLLTMRPLSGALMLRDMFSLENTRSMPNNVWIGVTCENGTENCINRLLNHGPLWWYDFRTSFVSFEPTIGPVRLPPLSRMKFFDFAIIGGEIGPNARPFHLEWAIDLFDQLRYRGTKIFVKQLGSNPFYMGLPLKLCDKNGEDINEWPNDLRIREIQTSHK